MAIDEVKKNKMLRYRWLIFAVLLISYFFVYFQRMTPTAMAEDMVVSLGYLPAVAALFSSVYFYTYLAMQLPSGFLSDRFGPRMSSGLFLLLASLGAFLTSQGNSLEVLIIGKAMIAAGMALVYIPLLKILAVWFRKSEFASLTGVVIAVGNVGAIAASTPLLMLMDVLDWRGIFLLLGAVTLILALLCLLLIRNHPKDKGFPSIEEIEESEGIPISESTAAKIPMLEGMKIAFKGGLKFWMPTLSYFMVYGSIMIYQGLWMLSYYRSTFDFVLEVGWLLTMVGVGKIISAFALGIISDKFGISKKNIMIFGNICFLGIWAIIWYFGGWGDYWFWMFINFMFGFFGGFMTLSFSQVKEQFPIAISGTVVACMNIFLFGGAAIMQSLSYFIISTKSPQEFQTLWLIMMLCVLAACVFSALSVDDKKVRRADAEG